MVPLAKNSFLFHSSSIKMLIPLIIAPFVTSQDGYHYHHILLTHLSLQPLQDLTVARTFWSMTAHMYIISSLLLICLCKTLIFAKPFPFHLASFSNAYCRCVSTRVFVGMKHLFSALTDRESILKLFLNHDTDRPLSLKPRQQNSNSAALITVLEIFHTI